MLPRLQSTAQISKAALYEPADPPEIKPTRGVENLKNLKDYSDRMFLIHKGSKILFILRSSQGSNVE